MFYISLLTDQVGESVTYKGTYKSHHKNEFDLELCIIEFTLLYFFVLWLLAEWNNPEGIEGLKLLRDYLQGYEYVP